MESKAGAQIQSRAFFQSFIILLIIMVLAGILTRVVPPGNYARVIQEGREVIAPDSFEYTTQPDYPVWRWFLAPIEVLGGSDAALIITIIIFILFVGGAFAVLDKSGILQAGINRMVQAFGGRKYILLLVISLAFMLLGAFFGIFEEVVPLIPIMLALSYYLGWDALVGLGMSILATNLGFSAAITNPFTIGVAQRLAGLPLFSGAGFRVIFFIVVYIIFAIFIVRYARSIERTPEKSPVYKEDLAVRKKYEGMEIAQLSRQKLPQHRALAWLGVFLGLILLVLVIGPVLPAIAEFALPVVGLLFLLGGLGAGRLVGQGWRQVFKALWEGVTGIAPGIVLILMAVSIKHIVVTGEVMDTILYHLSRPFTDVGPYPAAMFIYALALIMEIFIGSGSAKAFLMMPILLPLADLVGVTRQIAVTAYCFGDGFSNLAYPTNPVLLISLGLTVVSYPRWLRWSLKLWFWIIIATAVFLWIAVLIGYGPF